MEIHESRPWISLDHKQRAARIAPRLNLKRHFRDILSIICLGSSMTALKHQNFQYPARQTLSSLSCGLDFLRPKICNTPPEWTEVVLASKYIKIPETFDKRMCKKGQEGSGPVDCGLELAPYQGEHAVAPDIMTPQKWFVTDWSCLIDIKHRSSKCEPKIIFTFEDLWGFMFVYNCVFFRLHEMSWVLRIKLCSQYRQLHLQNSMANSIHQ